MDSGVLLGYIIAHELGHLLLGPGHAPSGIMRATWDMNDLEAIRQGRLKFSREECARIRKILRDELSPTLPLDLQPASLDDTPEPEQV
jgi:hypothetical protein